MSTFQHQDTAPSNNLHAPVLESLKQNNQVGTQLHPLRDRLCCLLSTELRATSKHTHWHGPAHQKDKTQLHHQKAGTQPFYQEACTSPWTTQLHQWAVGQKQGELRSCSLWKGDQKCRKLDKTRWQISMLQVKEQDDNPQEQLNEEEPGNLPEKSWMAFRIKQANSCQ